MSMTIEQKRLKALKAPKSVRASVSLPPDIYSTLGQLARAKKVSVAWVMRDAAEKYVAEEWPLKRPHQMAVAGRIGGESK